MRFFLITIVTLWLTSAAASPLKYTCFAKKGERVTVKTDEDRTFLEVISSDKKLMYEVDADRDLEIANNIQFSSFEVKPSNKVHYLSVGQLLVGGISDKSIRAQMTITVVPQTMNEPVTTTVYNCK